MNEELDLDMVRIRIGILREYKEDLEKRVNEDLEELNGVIKLIHDLSVKVYQIQPRSVQYEPTPWPQPQDQYLTE